ncbi:MAG: siphovirus ReqiPepy6 Gp37-like family protein [Romboutsia sp.]
MQSIRILDKDFNLLGEIDSYEEFKIIRRFFSISEFELKINFNKLHSGKLIKNNLLLLGKNYNKVCIILHREIDGDGKKDNLLIKGYTLEGLVSRRLIIPNIDESFESCIGKQETIIKHFVNKNCVTTVDKFRKIDNLIIAEDKARGKDDSWRSSYENLDDKLKEICTYCNLGWNITFDKDKKKFVFDVIEGRDLTVNQEINPPVIFRSDFNNIASRQYIESIVNSKNVAYAGTKGDSTKLVLSSGNVEGFERIESFKDVNLDDSLEIKKQADIVLNELAELKSFSLNIKHSNTFIYETDYDLGDVVTIQDRKLNITMNSRIVEITETHNKNGMKMEAVFGSSIPTFLDKIKMKVRG